MAKLTEIGLYKPTYQFYRELIKISSTLPKRYRFSIGSKMIDHSLKLVKLIARANLNRDYDTRKSILEESLSELEIIKLNFRLLVDLKLLSDGYYKIIFDYLESISKQLTGWYKKPQ